MTDKQKIKNMSVLLKQISDYLMDIALVVDDLEHDDITMTDDDKKEMLNGMLPWVYKMGKAVVDLEKEIKGLGVR